MYLANLEDVFNNSLQELLSSEVHLFKEFPRLIEGAYSSELKSMLTKHYEETRKHMLSLEELIRLRSTPSQSVPCRVIDALIKRGVELSEKRGEPILLDLALIFIMRQIEMYEIAAYESARLMGEALSLHDGVKLLDSIILDAQEVERSWVVLGEDMIDSVSFDRAERASLKVGGSQEGVL